MVALALVVASAVGALVAGCKAKGSGKPKVVVSIFPIYDLTRRIAGDRLEVVLVLPPGKSEHGYDPTPKEIARLEGARLGVAVGLDLDAWVEGIMKSAGGVPRMVHLGQHVSTLPIDVTPIGEDEAHDEHDGHDGHDDHDGHDGHDDHDDHDGHDDRVGKPAEPAKPAPGPAAPGDHAGHGHGARGAPDPHFWLDPQRAARVVEVLVAELSTLDPGGAELFARNGAALAAELDELDARIEARARTWSKRTIVTFHGSFTYYAARYGLRIAAVIEPLPGKEPTPQYVAEVLAAIRRGRAAALFSEPQLDRRPAEVIAAEGKLPLGELDPVGGLPGRDSYAALLGWNTEQLAKVLE